ncbi:FOL3, partial [Symbiodinium sp. CCMP2456]
MHAPAAVKQMPRLAPCHQHPSAMPRGEIDPGLGRVLSALDRLGSPQQSLKGRVLHVAGTNGKGSVCAMLFSALRQAKLRVAMFTSPHLVEPSDAFRLAEDGEDKDFPKEQLSSLQDEIIELCRPAEPQADARTLSLTTFELQVVMALTLFARQQVDVAIVEVGMGGRDDATNVLIEPAACAISSIAMDHEKFLGSTREEIASHKAGIFQTNRPAFVATSGMSQSVKKVIADCAKAVSSLPVTWVEPAEVATPTAEEAGEVIAEVQVLRVRGFNEELRLPLLGDYQRSNAALALAVLLELRCQQLQLRSREQVLDVSLLDDSTIAAGMAATKWAGRLEWLQLAGAGRVLLDGAHNPHAAATWIRLCDHTGAQLSKSMQLFMLYDDLSLDKTPLQMRANALVAGVVPLKARSLQPLLSLHPFLTFVESAAFRIGHGVLTSSEAAVLTLFASTWAFLRLPVGAPLVPRGSSLARRATGSSTRRPLDAEDFRELLEQPDGANNIQSILKELLEDEGQLKEYNSTFQELAAAQEGAADSDPLAKFLSDPQAVWSWLQSNDKTQELMQIMQGSVLFDKLLKFGSEVLERRQVAELSEGSLVEISGLSAAEHLNGLTGTLSEATEEEMQEHPGRRIIELEDGQGRIAVQPRNLIFPRHRPGDAVTLNAEFEPGTEHEGLERRAALVSTLTDEERELGFDKYSGRVVVDVLSLLPGGPILQRILMWPEHLQRRPFQAGDGVLLRNLEADTTLNDAAGTIEDE